MTRFFGPVIECDEVPGDTLQLRMHADKPTPWFDINTKYPNTRITVCPSLDDLEGLHNDLGNLIAEAREAKRLRDAG